jgi:hypothetical protein
MVCAASESFVNPFLIRVTPNGSLVTRTGWRSISPGQRSEHQLRRNQMQATSAFRKVGLSRRMLLSLMVAPLAALLLGGAGGYTLRTITAATAPAQAQAQHSPAPTSQGDSQRVANGIPESLGVTDGIPAPHRTGLQSQ